MTTPYAVQFPSIEQQAEFEKWKASRDKLPRTKGKAVWTQAEKELTLKRLDECYDLYIHTLNQLGEAGEPYSLAQTIEDSDEESNSQMTSVSHSFAEKPINKKKKL